MALRPSTLDLLTFIQLEVLRRQLDSARAADAGADVERHAAEIHLLAEIAHRLWPLEEENRDPEYERIMRKKGEILNLVRGVK
jgi:hypothetical protein